jgi:hypothetical protein
MVQNSWIECLYSGQWVKSDQRVRIDGTWLYIVPPGNYRARRVSVVVDGELQYDELAFGYTVERNHEPNP